MPWKLLKRPLVTGPLLGFAYGFIYPRLFQTDGSTEVLLFIALGMMTLVLLPFGGNAILNRFSKKH